MYSHLPNVSVTTLAHSPVPIPYVCSQPCVLQKNLNYLFCQRIQDVLPTTVRKPLRRSWMQPAYKVHLAHNSNPARMLCRSNAVPPISVKAFWLPLTYGQTHQRRTPVTALSPLHPVW